MDEAEPHHAGRVTIDPEQWLEAHGDVLFRYAYARFRKTDVAEDLVQETLLAGLRGQTQFENRSSEQTWLVGILKHKILDLLRKRAATGASDDSLDEATLFFDTKGRWKQGFIHWSSDPRQLMEQAEFRRVLDGCLSKLPGRLAEVFLLREGDDIPTGLICEQTGLSESNVWASLHRARMRLRQCLNLNWFESKSKV